MYRVGANIRGITPAEGHGLGIINQKVGSVTHIDHEWHKGLTAQKRP